MTRRAWRTAWASVGLGVLACDPDASAQLGGEEPTELPLGCDGALWPHEDACVLGAKNAVFVSSSQGSAQGDGSRQRPLAGVEEALQLARRRGAARVYLCGEVYPLARTLELADGVSVYGALSCAAGEWAPAAVRAALRSAATPVARAVNLERPARWHGVRIEAMDASEPGGSAIAVITANTPALTWLEVELVAGRGAAGADSVTPPAMVFEGVARGGLGAAGARSCQREAMNQAGADSWRYLCEPAGAGGQGGRGVCRGGTGELEASPGGDGGDGGVQTRSADGRQEVPFGVRCNAWWEACQGAFPSGGLPFEANARTNAGARISFPEQPSVALKLDRAALAGARGRRGAPGAPPDPLEVPRFSLSGYRGVAGAVGQHGGLGQGGGGGHGGPYALTDSAPYPADVGDFWAGVGGAGGGVGGCPGEPASAATAGGASIALLSFGALPVVLSGVLSASSAGKGGVGAAGGLPGRGGAGGAAMPGSGASAGAPGGVGGKAGISQSASHGPSIAWAWTDQEPMVPLELSLRAAEPVPATAPGDLDGQPLHQIAAGLAGASMKVHGAAK